jgi:hypothetical protein
MSDHSCNIYYDHSKNAGVKSEKIIVVKIIADASWLCAWTFG